MNFLTSDSTTMLSDVQESKWVRLISDSPVYKNEEKNQLGSVLFGHNGSVAYNKQHLRYFQQLARVLGQSSVSLPKTAELTSQQLLSAILEFKPHQIGMSLIVDEDAEASLVLTSYWPEGTLHLEHFFHFPADEPVDTVVNFYNKPTSADQVPTRQWGWHSIASEFQVRLREQLRSGQWALAHGW